jgi:hypothetical protein
MTKTYNRRSVLAAVGAAGAIAFGAQSVRARDPPYTKYTYAQTDGEGGRLSVAWYETYNGEFQEAQNGSAEENATRVTDPAVAPYYVAEATGPIVTLGNVLPGDSGAVLVGLLAERVPEQDEGMDVWFRPVLTGNFENGVTEPERDDGDDTETGTTAGELADFLIVRFFKDDGLIGGCDGRFWIDDTPITPAAPMASVFDSIDDGVKLTDGCLLKGERRCIGFTWELPKDTGNVVQTDGVTFDLEFVGLGCGSSNPWTVEGSQ